MARQLQTDRVLFGTVVVLLLFGLVMVFSASAVIAEEQYNTSYHFLIRQGMWAVIGLVLMVTMMNFDYRRLAKPTVIFPALAVQLVLLLMVDLAEDGYLGNVKVYLPNPSAKTSVTSSHHHPGSSQTDFHPEFASPDFPGPPHTVNVRPSTLHLPPTLLIMHCCHLSSSGGIPL